MRKSQKKHAYENIVNIFSYKEEKNHLISIFVTTNKQAVKMTVKLR